MRRLGSATTIVVCERGTGVHGSTPGGSGSINATALPVFDATRTASSPSSVALASWSPVAESHVTNVVVPAFVDAV